MAAVFPDVKARALDGQRVALPADFAGAPSVVVVAFHRAHQADAASWVPALLELQAARPGLRAYGLPTLPSGARLARPVLERALRAAITDDGMRAAMIPLFTDVAAFVRAVGLEDDARLAVLLLARDGRIAWHATGPWSADAGRELARAVADQLRMSAIAGA